MISFPATLEVVPVVVAAVVVVASSSQGGHWASSIAILSTAELANRLCKQFELLYIFLPTRY
jgi:hypothetical protein